MLRYSQEMMKQERIQAERPIVCLSALTALFEQSLYVVYSRLQLIPQGFKLISTRFQLRYLVTEVGTHTGSAHGVHKLLCSSLLCFGFKGVPNQYRMTSLVDCIYSRVKFVKFVLYCVYPFWLQAKFSKLTRVVTFINKNFLLQPSYSFSFI